MIPIPDDTVVIDNEAAGRVCAVCRLGPEATRLVESSRRLGYTQAEIADALSAGAGYRVSRQKVWHHVHEQEGTTK